MLKKCGKFMADWRDATGRRHRAAFPTKKQAAKCAMNCAQCAGCFSNPLVLPTFLSLTGANPQAIAAAAISGDVQDHGESRVRRLHHHG